MTVSILWSARFACRMEADDVPWSARSACRFEAGDDAAAGPYRAHAVHGPFRTRSVRTTLAALLTLAFALPASAQEDLTIREEAAIKAAVAHVAPSVVRIETIGGLERVGQVLTGSGPTTGLIVSAEGHIVSSAFNFAQQPASILAELADGRRFPARLVATDHNRMLVLLKIDCDSPLPVAEAVPEVEIHPGLWAIAVGRTYEGVAPNVSVGIVSGVGRIWGKALQTDAKISPANYGGPLVDIRGRVLGVLAPFAAMGHASGAVAGVELYDSGIGFAVPLAHVQSVLPRLQAGEDLHPGVLGINLRGADQFADPAVVAVCRANSPAYRAGLKADDEIVAIDGFPVKRQAQLKQRLGGRYAGDTVRLVVLRGGERLEREVELIAQLEPFQHPFLGLLPLRGADQAGIAIPGVVARYVYPGSPAAEAGILPGDAVTSLDGQPVANRRELAEKLAARTDEGPARLEVRHGDETRTVELTPAAPPEEVPADLPPSRAPRDAAAGERPAVGRQTLKLPEAAQECLAYVPEAYDPAVPHGVVVWLNAGGAYENQSRDDLLAFWKPLCDRDDLILLAPASSDGEKWEPAKDAPFIRKMIEQVVAAYHVDPARIVVHGREGGGALAYVLAFTERDLVRGAAVVDAVPAGEAPENEPIYPLALFVVAAADGPTAGPTTEFVARLRERKHPVTLSQRPAATGELSADELSELARWIDSLDRI